MVDKRKHPRYLSSAAVRIGDWVYTLKDIGVSGCCLKCPPGADDLVINQEYNVTLTAEPEARLAPFEFCIEPCWSRNTGDSREVGCFITRFPVGKQYQIFADYLAWWISRP
jgi:hypothetical protein